MTQSKLPSPFTNVNEAPMFPDGKPLNRLYVYEGTSDIHVYDPDEVLKATDPDAPEMDDDTNPGTQDNDNLSYDA